MSDLVNLLLKSRNKCEELQDGLTLAWARIAELEEYNRKNMNTATIALAGAQWLQCGECV